MTPKQKEMIFWTLCLIRFIFGLVAYMCPSYFGEFSIGEKIILLDFSLLWIYIFLKESRD